MPQDADPLSRKQIEILRTWIDQGANWPEGVGAAVESPRLHWAYIKPESPEQPPVAHGSWVRSDIDNFEFSCMLIRQLRSAARTKPSYDFCS